MGKKKDLLYYTQLNYDVIIRNHDNLYYLVIPELSLIVESEDLSKAYEKLEEKKKQLFSDMIISESEDAISIPRSKIIKKNSFFELPLFCIKTLLVFFVCISLLGVMFIGTLPLLNSLVISMPARIKTSTYALVSEATTKATNALVSKTMTTVQTKLMNLTYDEKQKLRSQYRKFLEEVKPFFDVTKTVFEEKNENKKNHFVPSEECN